MLTGGCMKIISVGIALFFCISSLEGMSESDRLRHRLHIRRFVMRGVSVTMTCTGTLLEHCGNPVNRVGYVIVLAEMVHNSHR